jgi:CBS domain-containing protein
MASVGDLMREGVISCGREATLGDVAELLAEHRIHAAFVVDDNDEPVGVISDFDLLSGEWLGSNREGLEVMRSIQAQDMMTTPVETIDVAADAAAAAGRLHDLKLARLLVTENGRAIGVISISDLVAPLGDVERERSCVGDVMSHGIVTCRPETPLWSAARAMTERRSRSLVVVAADGRPLGIVTGRDLLFLYGGKEDGTTVRDVMSSSLLTASPELPLRKAADLMLEHEVHRLIVVDPPNVAPLGIVSTSDIVAEMGHPRSVWRGKGPRA